MDALKAIVTDIGAFVGLVGLWVRIEVGQALNRSHIRDLKQRRTEDREEVREMLAEIRADIKRLLER